MYQIAYGHKNERSKINISLAKKIPAYSRAGEKLEALLHRKNQDVLKAMTMYPN